MQTDPFPSLWKLYQSLWPVRYPQGPEEDLQSYQARMLECYKATIGAMSPSELVSYRRELIRATSYSLSVLFLRKWTATHPPDRRDRKSSYRKRALAAFESATLGKDQHELAAYRSQLAALSVVL
ncbi:hypothetical protein AURDEDRAFT_166101 [Auricularia subglabra TFB-10046 SS5]|nr:hypothetical protein AURDEDRAFT_166101 [Auricularia subglabra TFB-10046 SS5]